MKRLLPAVCLCLVLTGCAEDPMAVFLPQETGVTSEITTESTAAPDPEIPTDTAPAAAAESRSVRDIYAEVLTALHDEALLPNGSPLETVGDIEENRFAVFDLDEDGREELILELTQAQDSDCFTAVYDVDADGGLRREIRYTAQLTFYTEGLCTAAYTDAGEEGDFIPYALCQYSEEQDVYTEAAYVSVIDRETLAAHDMLDEYPADADTSGIGRVYTIHGDTPVDVTEYEAWFASWHDGISEIEVPYQNLTENNIEAIRNEK